MIVVLRCVSLLQADAALHTTDAIRCPESVRYEYRLLPQNPRDYAMIRHYESLPRDDRAGIEKKAKVKKRVAKKKRRR